MTLPPELQHTLNTIQAQFECLQKRILELQISNQELVKAQEAKHVKQPMQEDKLNIPGTPAEMITSVEETAKMAALPKHHSGGPVEEGELAWTNKFNALRSSPFESRDMEEEEHDDLQCNATCVGEVFYKFSHDGNCMQKVTEGLLFKTISISAIAANTIYLGLAGDYNLRNSFRRLEGLPQEAEWTHPDIIFTSWFTLEIIIRLVADQLSFFTGEDQGWNIFDLLLVSESLVTLIVSYVSGGGSANSKLSFLRIFRVFRLVRVVRIVRSVKALAKLRTMIFAILNSFADLLWALVVVTLIVFVFAIIFMGGTAEYYETIDVTNAVQVQSARDVNLLFGDIGTTSLSLWSAISGGNDWMAYGEQLQKFSNPMYFYIFQFYIAFCCVGLFNVVTGVFVDSAVCVRTEDEIVAGYFDELRTTTNMIKSFFADADHEESGSLTFDEFSTRLRDPAVRAYFAGLDIDPEEAGIIFTIFDADKSNTIQINELVNGTMKLKGSASKLDLMGLMYDLHIQSMKLDHIGKAVRELTCVDNPLEKAQQRPPSRDLPRGQVVPPSSRAVDGLKNAVPQHRSSKDIPRGQVVVPMTKAVDGLVPQGQVVAPMSRPVSDGYGNAAERLSFQESQQERAQQYRATKDLPRGQVVAPMPRGHLGAVSPPRQRPAKLPRWPADSEN